MNFKLTDVLSCLVSFHDLVTKLLEHLENSFAVGVTNHRKKEWQQQQQQQLQQQQQQQQQTHSSDWLLLLQAVDGTLQKTFNGCKNWK